jgi:phage shock protein PspC (stress-responsive transcriptional regulator)
MLIPAPFFRDDTLFGVCAALGEDLGINPDLLRLLVAVGLFWGPTAAVAGYAGAAALVLLIRWLVPDPAPSCPAAANGLPDDESQACEELPLAA